MNSQLGQGSGGTAHLCSTQRNWGSSPVGGWITRAVLPHLEMMLAGSWHLGWAGWLQQLHVASPHVLGSLTKWWEGSKSNGSERERKRA